MNQEEKAEFIDRLACQIHHFLDNEWGASVVHDNRDAVRTFCEAIAESLSSDKYRECIFCHKHTVERLLDVPTCETCSSSNITLHKIKQFVVDP